MNTQEVNNSVKGNHYCTCNDYSNVDTSGTKCMRCNGHIPIASQEVNNSEEEAILTGLETLLFSAFLLGRNDLGESFTDWFTRNEKQQQLQSYLNEYAALKLKEYETAYNQVCERNDRLQEENDNLKKQLHDHNGMCQKKLSDQLNDVMRDLKAKQEEVDRLKEALTWYADSDNYLYDDTTLGSAWSMNKNIEKKAKTALQTP
jgi:DNA repair exonuclease SbcCD ATPase subunit